MRIDEAIRGLIGPDSFITDEDAMAPYLVDWRNRYHGRAQGVARPATPSEVAAVVRICAQNAVPVVPQGGNTGMCGGATPDPTGRAIVIGLDRMNRIRDVDPLNNAITVDAGCVLADIQARAGEVGRLFPMGLGSEGSCQIGGNLSTNAGGTAVLRYGTMRDLVLGLEVALPDGRIWNGLRALRKDSTGYDLKQLFIGAEGTLGIITGAVLKLFPTPMVSRSAMVALDGVEAALRLLAALRATCGDRLNAFEIMSAGQLALVLRHIPDVRNPVATEAPYYLMIEASDAAGADDLGGMLETVLGQAHADGTILDAVVASSEAQAALIWRLRHSVSEANMREGLGVSHDTSVPISRLPEFVADCTASLGERFPQANTVFVGHVGDGNIHVVVIFQRELFPDADAFERVATEVTTIVHDASAARGGSISAEHGIGQMHAARLARYKDPLELDLMRAIKRTLDPGGIMNPGKILVP
ncbi:MAG: FAD-binding oxidoreductase [Acetobacteraceae bacterium]|nr:FAD-binding oxidoreductase [Acetobacteraceae bacterium]